MTYYREKLKKFVDLQPNVVDSRAKEANLKNPTTTENRINAELSAIQKAQHLDNTFKSELEIWYEQQLR